MVCRRGVKDYRAGGRVYRIVEEGFKLSRVCIYYRGV